MRYWVLCSLLAVWAAAFSPQQSEALRLVQATERMQVRLTVLEQEFSQELLQDTLDNTLPHFAGSLQAKSPALLEQLQASLRGLGKNPSRPNFQQTQRLLDQARGLLVSSSLQAQPAFQAARIVQLLRLEGGVSESYEEAVDREAEAYYAAWAGFQRVKALWGRLRPALSNPAQVQEIERAMGVLGRLLPAARVPARLSDPEDAERAALDISFALEAALGTQLLSRELSDSLGLVQSQVDALCAIKPQAKALSLERALAAQGYYEEHLGGTLGALEPALHQTLTGLLEQTPQKLRSGKALGGDCKALKEALSQAGATLR